MPILLLVVTTIFFATTWTSKGAQETLRTIKFAAGDPVLIPAVRNFESSPFHWLYAVSNTDLASVSVNVSSFIRRRATVFILDENDRNWNWRLRKMKAWNVAREPNRPNIGKKGAIVARRLNFKEVYFHLFRCNCGHYTDYFLYGRVYGKKGKIIHLPINRSCPLHNVIDENTDVTSNDFKLKDGYGNSYDLLPFTPDMDPST